MHIKPIPATLIHGDLIVLMIFARALAMLPLPIGCLASRLVAVRQPSRHI
jgi:hypothetical protein